MSILQNRIKGYKKMGRNSIAWSSVILNQICFITQSSAKKVTNKFLFFSLSLVHKFFFCLQSLVHKFFFMGKSLRKIFEKWDVEIFSGGRVIFLKNILEVGSFFFEKFFESRNIFLKNFWRSGHFFQKIFRGLGKIFRVSSWGREAHARS